MFQPRIVSDDPPPLVRRLPKDDKALQASADCQRNLASANESLRQFRSEWFDENSPDLDRARRAARELEKAATDLRNAARDLVLLTKP